MSFGDGICHMYMNPIHKGTPIGSGNKVWGASDMKPKMPNPFINDETAELIKSMQSARNTLIQIGYTYHGGQYWKPPLGQPPKFVADDRVKQICDNLADLIMKYG